MDACQHIRLATLTVLLLFVIGCGSTTTRKQQPTFPDRIEGAAPVGIHVVTVEFSDRIRVSASQRQGDEFIGALFGGLAGAVVVSIVQNANNDQNETVAGIAEQILSDRFASFDFDAYIASFHSALNTGERWRITGRTDGVSSENVQAAVEAALLTTDTDYVVVLSGDFVLGEALEQLQVGIAQSAYSKSAEEDEAGNLIPTFERRFVVYTRKRPLQFRRMTDADRAELSAVVRRETEALLQDESANRVRVALRGQKQLRELEEARMIPLMKAFEESWTVELLETVLMEATPVMQAMLEFDWDENRTLNFPNTRTPKFSVEIDGKRRVREGVKLGSVDDYTILVERRGDYAAIPKRR